MLSKSAKAALQVALIGASKAANKTDGEAAAVSSHVRSARHASNAALSLVSSRTAVSQRQPKEGKPEHCDGVAPSDGEGCYYYYYYAVVSKAAEEDWMNPEPEYEVVEAATEPDAQKAADKCVNSKPDCGLLNDNMALMWGDVKDSVDE